MRQEKSTVMVLNLRLCSAQTIQRELDLVALDCSQIVKRRLVCSKNVEKVPNCS